MLNDQLEHIDEYVNIIIPVFNRPKKIIRSVKSVMSQDYNNWKLILVDDNSTDNTYLILEDLAKADSRISIKKNKEYAKGPAGARNSGLLEVNENYLAFLDSDDEWLPHHLSRCMQILKDNITLDCIVTDLKRITEDGVTVVESKFHDEKGIWGNNHISWEEGFGQLTYRKDTLVLAIQNRFTIGLHSSVFRSRLFKQLQLECITVAEDHLFTLEMINLKINIGFIDEIHLLYYIHANNISNAAMNNVRKNLKNNIQEAQMLRHIVPAKVSLNKVQLKAIGNRVSFIIFYLIGYNIFYAKGDYKQALKFYLIAVRQGDFDLFKMKSIIVCYLKLLKFNWHN